MTKCFDYLVQLCLLVYDEVLNCQSNSQSTQLLSSYELAIHRLFLQGIRKPNSLQMQLTVKLVQFQKCQKRSGLKMFATINKDKMHC